MRHDKPFGPVLSLWLLTLPRAKHARLEKYFTNAEIAGWL